MSIAAFLQRLVNFTIQFFSFWWLELLVVLVRVQWSLREGDEEEEQGVRLPGDTPLRGQLPGPGNTDQEV